MVQIQVSLKSMHNFTCLLYFFHITDAYMNMVLKKENGQSFPGAVQKKSNLAASSLQSHLITFWSPQLWMLLSQLQNETQRLHQKPSCLSDAAYCNTGQLRWMLRPLRSCWKRLAFFFFSAHFFLLHSVIIYQKKAELLHSWQPLGQTMKKKTYVDIMPTILLFFSYLCPTGKTAEGHELC